MSNHISESLSENGRSQNHQRKLKVMYLLAYYIVDTINNHKQNKSY